MREKYTQVYIFHDHNNPVYIRWYSYMVKLAMSIYVESGRINKRNSNLKLQMMVHRCDLLVYKDF